MPLGGSISTESDKLSRLDFLPETAFRIALARMRSTGSARARRFAPLAPVVAPDAISSPLPPCARMCSGVVPQHPPSNAHAERGGFAREQREIFRRRPRIDDAIAHALRESRIGHRATAESRQCRRKLFQIGSSDCGPSVQFVPMACTFLVAKFRGGIRGRVPPDAVPSSEKVICATMGNLRK